MAGSTRLKGDHELARTFHSLDALRGLAAITILLFHAAFFYGVKTPREGQMAVDLFFVMSGFIIAHRYDADFRSGMSVRSFLAIRLTRLYPLYLLGAVLGLVPALLAIGAGDNDWFHRGLVASFPLHVLMLPSWFVVPRIEEIYPINYVAWSLVLELIINLAYAATFRFWTVSRLALLIGLAFIGLCICAAAYGSLLGGFAWQHVPVGIARVLYAFPMGVLLCRLFQRESINLRVPWWLLLCMSMAIFEFDVAWMRPFWEVLFVTILIPLIVAAAIVNEPPKVLHPICAWAGVFSYVLYSLQAPYIGLFIRGEERLHVDLLTQSVAKSTCFTAFLLLLCLAAHFAYDKPLRQFLSRSRKRVPRAVAANS